MKQPFYQGSLSSECGIYSICNAYKLVHKASNQEVENVYREIIEHLSKKKILKDVLLDGMNHKIMSDVILNVVGDRFSEKLSNFKWAEYTLTNWWDFTKDYLKNEKTSVILSLGGKENHYSTIESMTDKIIKLHDSDNIFRIRKGSCKMQGYLKEDKYIIFGSQCWLIKG